MFYRHRKFTNRQIATKKLIEPQDNDQNNQHHQLRGNIKYYEIIQQQYPCVFKRCGFKLFQVFQHEKGLLKNCFSLLQAMSTLPLYFYSKTVQHPSEERCFWGGQMEMWMETKYSILSLSMDEKEEERRKSYEEQINSFLVENLIPKLQLFKKLNLSLQSQEQQQFSSSEQIMLKFKKEIMDNINRQFQAYTNPEMSKA